MEKPVKVMGINIYPYMNFDSLIEENVFKKKILLSVNAEILLKASVEIRAIYNQNIGYPDGIGAVMALHRLGIKRAVKLPGCELWLKIVEKYYKSSTFYLIGATEGVIQQTVSKLRIQFENIQILGYRNGYISNDDYPQIINDILKLKPDFIFVAMGMPKQELLMNELSKVHRATYLGLGGSFDVYTGNVKRAPKWWVDHNLEFAYRLIKQPSRIKRQIHLIHFLILVMIGKI